jgi:hypothetical protein
MGISYYIRSSCDFPCDRWAHRCIAPVLAEAERVEPIVCILFYRLAEPVLPSSMKGHLLTAGCRKCNGGGYRIGQQKSSVNTRREISPKYGLSVADTLGTTEGNGSRGWLTWWRAMNRVELVAVLVEPSSLGDGRDMPLFNYHGWDGGR